MKRPLIALVVVALAGCSTTGKGYKNPEFSGYTLTSTAVAVMDSSEFGAELENRIAKALSKRGVRAYPTRDIARFAKSSDDYLTKVWAKGAVDMLVVQYGDAAESSIGGYQVFGSSTSYGGYTSSSTTAVPVRTYSREMQMRAAIFTRDNDKVWEANTEKFAVGLLFTGDGSMMRGSVKALLEAMEEDGLIR